MRKKYQSKIPNKVRTIIYWVITSLLLLELVYGAMWDFNILNKGFVATVMTRLGYPSYLPFLLGTSKLLATICLIAPKLIIVKEWAYAGLMIMFLGAVYSHSIVGGDTATLVFLSVCIGLTLLSYCFRPNSRR